MSLGDRHQREKARQDDQVGSALSDRIEDRSATIGGPFCRPLGDGDRDTGIFGPSDRARCLACTAITWTMSAFSSPSAIKSMRFWRVVPPPETQTANRIGESRNGDLEQIGHGRNKSFRDVDQPITPICTTIAERG